MTLENTLERDYYFSYFGDEESCDLTKVSWLKESSSSIDFRSSKPTQSVLSNMLL
jgi:hypothetical protein